jgi:glyoxalase superfamily protein
LAKFYRQLIGLRCRPGHSPPAPGQPDPRGHDWLAQKSPATGAVPTLQKVDEPPKVTWPDGPVPQQFHLDTTVPTAADLNVQHERALALDAQLLKDRSDDLEEPLRIYADPAGHPFASLPADRVTSPGGIATSQKRTSCARHTIYQARSLSVPIRRSARIRRPPASSANHVP